VRGPKYVVKRGGPPVLSAAEARQLLDSIERNTLIGLRDRALIGLMVYSFARVGEIAHAKSLRPRRSDASRFDFPASSGAVWLPVEKL
jgi:site-specific recombinase XerD